VAVLLAGCGELPFGGIEVAQESVVSLDRGVQVGQGRGGDGEGADVGKVDLGCDSGAQPVARVEGPRLVAGFPADVRCPDAVGVGPDLQDG
jgi:hypothetical protein